MTNHNKWFYKSHEFILYTSDEFYASQCSWNACKQKILEVLKNKAINKESNDYKYILEQVEKL